MSQPSNGGVPARRAVVRWAVRLARREWRQQVLVLALITVAVAAAILGASAAYNVTPSRGGEFGTADRRIHLGSDDPTQLARDIAALRTWTGTVDVIGHRTAPVPGSVETVDVRAEDLHGSFTGPMLALRAGRYPTVATDVALTDETAKLLDAHLGSALVLDGRRRTVVGLVENPSDLSDEFALVAPAHADPPESVIVLARVGDTAQHGLPADVQSRLQMEGRGATEKTTGAVLALVLATVVLLLIGLVAAAGFVVVAQRRVRQLGMLAAIGATERHLRMVVLANGVVVGVAAAVMGAAAALVGWVALAPRLEGPAGHRIPTFDVPWWLIVSGMVLAVVTATAAAWWPARAMARVPITEALSARPATPKPARRSSLAAGALLLVGFACLTLGIDTVRDKANAVLVIAGVLTIVIGVLLACPMAVRSLAVTASRLPVGPRLALRDLGRHQARAGAALAAITLGLGIAVAVVVIATGAAPEADEGNLSNRQLIVHVGDDHVFSITEMSPAELARFRADVGRFAAGLDQSTVLTLDGVVNPKVIETAHGRIVRPAVTLARQLNPHSFRYAGTLFVATPELLDHLGLDAVAIRPDADVLTRATGELRLLDLGKRGQPEAPKIQTVDVPGYSSLPHALITPDAVRRHGWTPATVGWVVESASPLTDVQLADARAMAAEDGLTVESRRSQQGLATVRTGATVAGALLALGVLAMTVGLIRAEAAGDLRTLTATGASGRVRRGLTAATAGALAILGAVLGGAGAYLALVAAYWGNLGRLAPVPVLDLAVIVLGLPVLAAGAGWLLAGREPDSFGRVVIA